MGSFTASAEAAGPDFLVNLLKVVGGIDGSLGAVLGSLGEMIGVEGGDAAA